MFNNKKIIYILLLFICMALTISFVNAHDNITKDIGGEKLIISQSTQNKSFNDLNNEINNDLNKSEIKLTNNYTYQDDDSKDGISINRSLTIDGQNHIIDGKHKSKILIINAINVTLKNIIFMNGNANLQMAGAIFFTSNSSGNIINCTFIHNKAYTAGAIFYDENTTGIIIDSVFINNNAGYGGAIFQYPFSNTLIKNCIFHNNKATMSPDYGGGGAIVYSLNSTGTVENSIFTNSSSTSRGGAIAFLQDSSGKINNCTFKNNDAKDGGAVYHTDHANTTISNSIFIDNKAKNGGGAIYNTWTDNTILNSTFTNNKADKGGAIYNYKGRNNLINKSIFIENSATRGGGVYYRDLGKGIVNNSIFIENSAQYGGGVYYPNNESRGIVNNTLFARNYAKNISTTYRGNAYNCTIIKITPKIMLDKLNFIFNNEDYLKILFKGFNNSLLTNNSVNVEITGIFNNAFTTNSNGEIIISTKNLLIGSYKVIVSFTGDDNYENTTITQNLFITKIPTKIEAKNKKFKAKKKHKKYIIFLKDYKNNAIIKTKVTLKVKNKKYILKSNKKGKIIFKIKKINKKGKYKSIVKFTGNTYYNAVTKKVKIIIK